MEPDKKLMKIDNDRISDLPINLIDHILSRLPFRDAARTTVLSKKWRHKWSELPCLIFDSIKGLWSYKERLGSTDLEIIIDHILLLHRGPILKFKIKFDGPLHSAAIDRWITYLSRSRIMEFELESKCNYRVLSCLYDWQSLTRLALHNSSINPPSAFKGFPNLKSLELFCSKIAADVLENIISTSPVLEKLALVLIGDLSHFTVKAPKLKYFLIFARIQGISFENTFCLTDVTAVSYKYLRKSDQNLISCGNLLKFCAQLPMLRKLYINSSFMKCLVVGITPSETCISCPNLDSLHLEMNLNNQKDFLNAYCILSTFRNLRKLIITDKTANSPREEVSFATRSLLTDFNYSFIFAKLRDVEINGCNIKGTCQELEFMQFLLWNSSALEKMVVRHTASYAINIAVKLTLVEKLLSLRRASKHARVYCVGAGNV